MYSQKPGFSRDIYALLIRYLLCNFLLLLILGRIWMTGFRQRERNDTIHFHWVREEEIPILTQA